MIICFLALGTGAARYAHALEHARQDAAAADAHEAGEDHHHSPTTPRHDETTCEFHARLSAPMISGGMIALLVCMGVFVAFVSLISQPLQSQRLVVPFDSRGPPAC